MKVAVIKSNYTPYGGGEKYATRLIRAFSRRNIFVDVLTAVRGEWSAADDRVRWVHVGQIPVNNLLRLISFNASVRAHLEKNGYDCIFGMDRTDYQTHIRAGGGCHAAWLDRRCAESSVLRCMSFRLNPFHRAMLRLERTAFLSDRLVRLICNSALVRDEICRYYPAAERKVTVVHNGVEWSEMERAFEQGMTDRESILGRLGIKANRFYYLFVGSGYERKGLEKAIRALNGLPKETELLVIGKDRWEGYYRRLARRTGVAPRVHFFGPRKDIRPFFQGADAFVLPTLYDPFSNASLEALAMGLFTITSAANGCTEVITEGAGRIIGDLRDGDAVIGAMRSALEPHLPKREIRDTVRNLDFDRQLDRIVDICVEDVRSEVKR